MTGAHPSGEFGGSGRPDPDFSRIVAEQGIHDLADQTAAGAQVLRDSGELAAMEAWDISLNSDALIDRELRIKELAADMVANGTHSPEDAEAFVRRTYQEQEEKLARSIQARYNADAAFIENFGGSLAASLRHYAGISPNAAGNPEKTRRGPLAWLKQSKLGKWALGGLVNPTDT